MSGKLSWFLWTALILALIGGGAYKLKSDIAESRMLERHDVQIQNNSKALDRIDNGVQELNKKVDKLLMRL